MSKITATRIDRSGRPPGVAELTIDAGGVALAGEEAGEGLPVVLLHGLTATRRYVVMGSKNARARRPPGGRLRRARPRRARTRAAPEYGYDALAADLLAVLDDRGIDRAVLAGASMGAHTLVRASRSTTRSARPALVVITPAFEPGARPRALERWDALARGLREGGVDGFVEAYGEPRRARRRSATRSARCCASACPRTSTPRRSPTRCGRCRARDPFGVLGRARAARPAGRRRREPRRGRPRATRTRSASATPRRSPARGCVSEEPGKSPLAWQGGQLSRVIAETAEKV